MSAAELCQLMVLNVTYHCDGWRYLLTWSNWLYWFLRYNIFKIKTWKRKDLDQMNVLQHYKQLRTLYRGIYFVFSLMFCFLVEHKTKKKKIKYQWQRYFVMNTSIWLFVAQKNARIVQQQNFPVLFIKTKVCFSLTTII